MSLLRSYVESEFFDATGFFTTGGVTLDYTKWGYRDVTPLIPELRHSQEYFDREIFNLVYHLKQPLTEVMRWSYRERKTMWRLYLEQREFEESRLKRD